MALTSGERRRYSTTIKIENYEYLTELSAKTLLNQSKLLDLAVETLKKEYGNDVAKIYARLQEG